MTVSNLELIFASLPFHSHPFCLFPVTGLAHMINEHHGHPPPEVERLEFSNELKRKMKDPDRCLASAKELFDESVRERTANLTDTARLQTLAQ